MATKQKVEFVITARDLTRVAFRRIRRSIGGIGRAIGKLGALAGVGGLAAAATKVMQTGRAFTLTAQRIGLTTTELQALNAVAVKAGIRVEDLEDGLHSISTARSEALGGDKAQQRSLRNLGISMDFARGRRNPLDFIMAISAQMQAAGANASDLAEDLNRVFGEDVTRRLIPLLSQGPANLIGGMTDAVTSGAVASAAALERNNQTIIGLQEKQMVVIAQAIEGLGVLTEEAIAVANSLARVREVADSAQATNLAGVSGSDPGVFSDNISP